jgi:uncharacterized membrane protein YcaP (DUF421 family)
MENFFFSSWEGLLRTFITTLVAYMALILLLRSSGKRTLSKMNAFDFIVTIALGSSLATVMLSKTVVVLEGLLAFFLLIFLQYAITWLSSRYTTISNLVKSTPTLLLYRGEMIQHMMKKERIAIDEIYAALREKGFTAPNEVDAVILETDGSLTVIEKVENGTSGLLKQVKSK